MLPSKIRKAEEFYSIRKIADWTGVTAHDILSLKGVGGATLDRLRLYLAHRGLHLRDDNPAEYWIEALCGSGAPEPWDATVAPCPFTILRDSNETYPYEFTGITDGNNVPLLVPVKTVPLWPRKLADYTIEGMEDDIQIERKADDLEESLSGRRAKFEKEIAHLDGLCEFAAIVIERDWTVMLGDPAPHGPGLKSISRTWISWSIRYPNVRWFFCSSRDHAENVTFRLLERFWNHKQRAMAKGVRGDRTDSIFGIT